MKTHIIYTIIIISLVFWVLTLNQEIKKQAIYWEVLIENSPAHVQNVFYELVDEKLK